MNLETLQEKIKASLGNEVFYLDLRPDWGSEHPQHRQEIRKGLLEFIKKNHPDQMANSIWDLQAPPVLKSYFVSISHCEGMGGFVFCSKAVGLDVENKDRIKSSVIDRISTAEERARCPRFELLWTAKEAVFKSTTEFYTISHIEIKNWTDSQNETFQFSCSSANGWAFSDSKYAYAIALKKS